MEKNVNGGNDEEIMVKRIEDLGAASYLLMFGYKVIGKENQNVILFQINKTEEDEFDQQALDYLSSEYHRFDSCLMSLKKIKSKTPPNNRY